MLKQLVTFLFLSFVFLCLPSLAHAIELKVVSEGTIKVNETFSISYSGLEKNGCYAFFSSKAGLSVKDSMSSRDKDCKIEKSDSFYSNILPESGALINIVASQPGDYTVSIHRYQWWGLGYVWCITCAKGTVQVKVIADPSSQPTPSPSLPPSSGENPPSGSGKQRGEVCTKNTDCAGNLVCGADYGLEYGHGANISKCIDLHAIATFNTCVNGLECTDSDDVCRLSDPENKEYLCRARNANKRGRGKECREDNQCSTNACLTWTGDTNRKLCMALDASRSGLVLKGQFCYDSKECEKDLICKPNPQKNGLGECVAGSSTQPSPTPTLVPANTGGRGKICAKNSECAQNLVCAAEYGNGGNTSRCVDIVQRKDRLATCTNSLECEDEDVCVAGDESSTNQVCKSRNVVGEKAPRGRDCKSNVDCASSLSCEDYTPGRKICTAVQNQFGIVPLGQFCYTTKECRGAAQCKLNRKVYGIDVGECVAAGQQPPANPGSGQQPPPAGGQPAAPASPGGGNGGQPAPTVASPNASPTGRPNLQEKVVCNPEKGIPNQFDSNKITVTNNTSAAVSFTVQYNQCQYRGQQLPLPNNESSKCDNHESQKRETLPAGATKTYDWVNTHAALPACTHGQIDVYNFGSGKEGCTRPDNGQKWSPGPDGSGLGFAVTVNQSGCGSAAAPGGSAPGGGTAGPTRPVYQQGSLRTYSCTRTVCQNNTSSVRVCELQCTPNN